MSRASVVSDRVYTIAKRALLQQTPRLRSCTQGLDGTIHVRLRAPEEMDESTIDRAFGAIAAELVTGLPLSTCEECTSSIDGGRELEVCVPGFDESLVRATARAKRMASMIAMEVSALALVGNVAGAFAWSLIMSAQ